MEQQQPWLLLSGKRENLCQGLSALPWVSWSLQIPEYIILGVGVHPTLFSVETGSSSCFSKDKEISVRFLVLSPLLYFSQITESCLNEMRTLTEQVN